MMLIRPLHLVYSFLSPGILIHVQSALLTANLFPIRLKVVSGLWGDSLRWCAVHFSAKLAQAKASGRMPRET